jgi:hypothetical protein
MTIRLDSEHAHLRRDLQLLAAAMTPRQESAPEIVIIGFQELKPLLEKRIASLEAKLEALRENRPGLTQRVRRKQVDGEICEIELELEKVKQTYSLYHEARDVKTSLRISRRQQELLVEAGLQAVARQSDRICALLK